MQTFIKHDYDMKIDPLCHEKKLNMLSKGEKKKEGRQTTKCYSLLSSLHWVKDYLEIWYGVFLYSNKTNQITTIDMGKTKIIQKSKKIKKG